MTVMRQEAAAHWPFFAASCMTVPDRLCKFDNADFAKTHLLRRQHFRPSYSAIPKNAPAQPAMEFFNQSCWNSFRIPMSTP